MSTTTMKSVNIHEAKTHLSRLIEEAVAGEPFIIAKAGKPKVVVRPYSDESRTERSPVGFMPELVLPVGWEEGFKSDNELIESFYTQNLFPVGNDS